MPKTIISLGRNRASFYQAFTQAVGKVIFIHADGFSPRMHGLFSLSCNTIWTAYGLTIP